MLLLLSCCCVLLVFYAVYRVLEFLVLGPKRRYELLRRQQIPSLPFIPVRGNSAETKQALADGEFLRLKDRRRTEFGPLMQEMLGPINILSLADADYVECVWKTQLQHYQKGQIRQLLIPLLGEESMALMDTGAEHSRLRKTLAPSFHFAQLKAMVSIMTKQTQLSLERVWAGHVPSEGGSVATGARVELHRWFAELTLSIMLASSFGTSVTDDPTLLREIVAGLNDYLHLTRQRVTSGIAFVPIACDLPIAGKRDLDRISATLNASVEQIIRDRRAGRSHSTCEGDDLLDILLKASDANTGKGFSDDVIRSQSLTFVVAGTDTTSSLLTWLVRDLSQRPELWQRCREEVQRVTGGDDLDTSHLPQLGLLDACIHECLRTRPAAPSFSLMAKDDHWLQPGNDKRPIFVPAGTLVRAETYLIQRDKALWGEEADRWSEERWLTKEDRPKHAAAFTAFSLGARSCAGPQFALMEAKSVMATLLSSVELDIEAGQPDAVTQKLVLEPLNGLYATLKKSAM